MFYFFFNIAGVGHHRRLYCRTRFLFISRPVSRRDTTKRRWSTLSMGHHRSCFTYHNFIWKNKIPFVVLAKLSVVTLANWMIPSPSTICNGVDTARNLQLGTGRGGASRYFGNRMPGMCQPACIVPTNTTTVLLRQLFHRGNERIKTDHSRLPISECKMSIFVRSDNDCRRRKKLPADGLSNSEKYRSLLEGIISVDPRDLFDCSPTKYSAYFSLFSCILKEVNVKKEAFQWIHHRRHRLSSSFTAALPLTEIFQRGSVWRIRGKINSS